MTIKHLSQPIAGLLRNYPVGTLDFVLDDKGNALSDKEARVRLHEMLEQGQKYIPTTDECVGFDPITGCPGHEELAGSDLTRETIPDAANMACDAARNGSGLMNLKESYVIIRAQKDMTKFPKEIDVEALKVKQKKKVLIMGLVKPFYYDYLWDEIERG